MTTYSRGTTYPEISVTSLKGFILNPSLARNLLGFPIDNNSLALVQRAARGLRLDNGIQQRLNAAQPAEFLAMLYSERDYLLNDHIPRLQDAFALNTLTTLFEEIAKFLAET